MAARKAINRRVRQAIGSRRMQIRHLMRSWRFEKVLELPAQFGSGVFSHLGDILEVVQKLPKLNLLSVADYEQQ